jgi:hypothetical protein
VLSTNELEDYKHDASATVTSLLDQLVAKRTEIDENNSWRAVQYPDRELFVENFACTDQV